MDAFIGQYDAPTRKVPKIAAEIARRLLAAGRIEEAWQAIEAAAPKAPQRRKGSAWTWPALDRAAALVLRRADELDGDLYEVLTPAADALAGQHPLAATLVLRAMIGFALTHSRSSRYRHAARHLLECESLASSVSDWGAIEPHEAYVVRLKAEHGRKSSFWGLVA